MSSRQTFLDQLRANLTTYPSGAVDDYIDYYDELISERVANGKKEAAVVAAIGSPKDIAASFKQDNAIEQAVKKPTISNGLKALIAVLSVLSLPLLLPVLAVCIAVIAVICVLFVAGFALVVGAVVTPIFAAIDMASIVLAGDAPLYMVFLVSGIAIVAATLAIKLAQGLIFSAKWIIRTAMYKLKNRQNKKKQSYHAASEEQ